jgi:hypothetical protein
MDQSVERLNEHSLEDCLGRQKATAIYIVGGWVCHGFNTVTPAENNCGRDAAWFLKRVEKVRSVSNTHSFSNIDVRLSAGEVEIMEAGYTTASIMVDERFLL